MAIDSNHMVIKELKELDAKIYYVISHRKEDEKQGDTGKILTEITKIIDFEEMQK